MNALAFIVRSARNFVRTYREEGLPGVNRKLSNLAWKLRYPTVRALSELLPFSYVSARGGVRMVPNFHDHTFCLDYLGDNASLREILLAIRRPFCLMDIGANQGYYTLIGARNAYCLKVLAVEPVAETRRFLEQNVRLNNCHGLVAVLPFGISDHHGVSRIKRFPGHSGMATLRDLGVDNAEDTEQVDIRPLRALAPEIPDGCAVFVKIDVEGHEEQVIGSLMESEFLDRTAWVFFEVDEEWVRPDQITTMLLTAGTWDFIRIGDGSHYDIFARREGTQVSP